MRCPFRQDMLGGMPECERDCALLVSRRCKDGREISACAIAIIAKKGCEPGRAWTNIFEEGPC